jgi:hypothetical protein
MGIAVPSHTFKSPLTRKKRCGGKQVIIYTTELRSPFASKRGRNPLIIVSENGWKEVENNKVKCDCCGTEILAEINDEKLIIMDRRHGKKHMVVLTLEDIITKMKNLPHLRHLQIK